MKNKKIKRVIITFLLFITSFAAFGELAMKTVFDKLLAIHLHTYMTNDMVAKVIAAEFDGRTKYSSPFSRFNYRYVRETIFKDLFSEEVGDDLNAACQAIVLAQFKRDLNQNGDPHSVLKFYREHAQVIRKEYDKLKPDQQKGFRQRLAIAQQTFNLLQWAKSRQLFMDYHDTQLDALARNLSPEEIAAKSYSGRFCTEGAVASVFLQYIDVFKDEDLAKFGMRRFNEGGLLLLAQYRETLDEIVNDFKE